MNEHHYKKGDQVIITGNGNLRANRPNIVHCFEEGELCIVDSDSSQAFIGIKNIGLTSVHSGIHQIVSKCDIAPCKPETNSEARRFLKSTN